MAVIYQDGWLKVPYDGPELTVIEIGLDGVFTPAFRDYAADGSRIVQIQATPVQARAAHVSVRVNGRIHRVHRNRSGAHGAAPGVRHSVS
jgi:hypothetical protein